MDAGEWREEITRGGLSHALLASLAARPRHGYDLVNVLRAHGFVRVKGGTVYPLLRRLEERGLVEPTWDTSQPGAARKVYTLTAEGAVALDNADLSWRQVGADLAALREEGGAR